MKKRMQSFFEKMLERENHSPHFFFVLASMVILYFQHLGTKGFFHDGYLYANLGKNAYQMGRWLIPFHSETQYFEFFHNKILHILKKTDT